MKVMVVGAGVMGRNHVRVLNGLSEIDGVLVVDAKQECLDEINKAKFDKVQTFSSIENALKEKPDACTIVTPTASHYAVFSKVNGKVKGILVEKPISDTVETGRRIVEEAKKHDTMLQIGHIERFNPGVAALKKHVAQIGTLRYATAHRFGIPTNRIADDVIIDLVVHDIDALCFISGERPKSVMAMERSMLEKNTNDLATILLEFPSFQATLEANRVTTVKIRELTLVGAWGNALLDYISQSLVLTHADVASVKYDSFDEVVTRVGKGTEVRPYFHKDEPLKLELKSFLNVVRQGKQSEVTGEDGLNALSTAAAAIESAKTGKKVEIKH